MSGLNTTCSIVVPVYNRGDLLRQLLDDLTAQSICWDEMEIIICDDGSIEDLQSIVDDYAPRLAALRYVRQLNQGPAAARNLGIQHANADTVVFIDSDVRPDSQLIEHLLHALATNPDWQGAEAKLVATGGQIGPGWDAPESMTGGHYHTAAIAYRKSALLAVGGMDEEFKIAACEDVELAVQLLRLGTIGFVPEAIAYHPRRMRSLRSAWRSRRNWQFVMRLAVREGFMGWPDNPTRFPRLRTAWCATVSLPAGRLLTSLAHFRVSPAESLRCALLNIVEWFGGIAMLPTILLAPVPPRRSRLSPTNNSAV